MDIRLINGSIIRELLTPEVCISLLEETMRQVSRGEAVLPLRQAMPLPNGRGLFGMMPGYLGAGPDRPDTFGIKLLSLFPENSKVGLPSHLGLMVLSEAETGKPLAILNADIITSLRTAAASGLATRVLSRPDSQILAIIGTGEQARSHVRAMLSVRDIKEILVWGRNEAHAQALCEQFSDIDGVVCEPRPTVEAAVRNAEIICTVTASKTPILYGRWISVGAHLNLVGSSTATVSEVDTEAVTRGKFYVDYRNSALNEAGELLKAIEQGAISESHILGEIGSVMLGEIPGRQRSDDITIYKSLGISAQDLSVAWYLYRHACERGLGELIEL